ncbi:PH domain-containing protein [Apiospora phragmitis]|uniref:PH domain-containing protein n=1 Tax=Apiospora phragmitis TaxID=2905665 RepID=A0ABR1TSZ3_9PEZI
MVSEPRTSWILVACLTDMMNVPKYTQSYMASEQSRREMQQKTRLHDPFFGLKGPEPRPSSIATEIVDTDWDEDDDIISENEDDGNNSPRISLNSSGQQSMTTLSSYEEAHTPRTSRTREAYPIEYDPLKPVEGPRGPHLFRASSTSSSSFEYEEALSLSPITPRAPKPLDAESRYHYYSQEPLPPRMRSSPFQFTHEVLHTENLASWQPEKVAQWMLNAGVEPHIAEKFIENDITGAILMTLKSEDLKELGIGSLGIRMKLWHHVSQLRGIQEKSSRPTTPIENEESREARKERRRGERCDADAKPSRGHSKRRMDRPAHEDIISPLESVSIVGIEQVIPKPHKCSKGEACKTWRKQQRMIEEFKKEHPFADTVGGVILVAGDPGNASTAKALNRPSSTEALRPMSDAVPSVVASSDVLGPGPGMGPFQYLQEATLRNVQAPDPQDNVRQFLDFQHQEGGHVSQGEVPPTPPFELYSNTQAPHEGLRTLPKLSIPGRQTVSRASQRGPSHLQQSFTPYRMERAEALSPDLQTPVAPYRFGTPFSEMDIPVTAVPLGPVARDASQSVPPDMSYRAGPSVPVRTFSRASRRPSTFQTMAPLEENAATPTARTMPYQQQQQAHQYQTSPTRSSPRSPHNSPPRAPARSQQPLHAPPRAQYPWSPQQRSAFEHTLPSLGATSPEEPAATRDAEGISYQGPVRKRKTKMLRHEWHDHYATLKGTRLAIHKDVETRRANTLEYIDIDDYAIACSSLASTSKLNAAFKAMSISRSSREGKDNKDVAAFAFQLIPQGKEALTARLHKRESSLGSSTAAAAALAERVNGTGKTHHFAVRSRDERIDWMRELMLAKALKQKGEGFEISVNGAMI